MQGGGQERRHGVAWRGDSRLRGQAHEGGLRTMEKHSEERGRNQSIGEMREGF